MRVVVVALAVAGLSACEVKVPESTEAPAPELNQTPEADPFRGATPAVQRPGPTALIEDERNSMDVFGAAGPATVFVSQGLSTSNRRSLDWFGSELGEIGSGTGFVWDKRGHVVTNFHVVDTEKMARRLGRDVELTVKLSDGKSYAAVMVGGDRKKDIAVLRIDAPADKLVPIRLPPDGFEPVPGQKALAIGNPFGLDHTLTTGVVSATGREVEGYGEVTIRNMIQTDASINPGNSGGPLLNSAGELIGMNTMIYSKTGSSAGIGFAVPVQTVRNAVPQIIETGHVQRAGLGVEIAETGWGGGGEGVAIARVLDGSPASRAGLRGFGGDGWERKLGDVIVGIDEHDVQTYNDLYTALDHYDVGDSVRVRLRREGELMELRLELTLLDPPSP